MVVLLVLSQILGIFTQSVHFKGRINQKTSDV